MAGAPLRELNLERCGLGASAARYLGLALSSWPLEELQVSYNRFGAAEELVSALLGAKRLRRVRLMGCDLNAEAMAAGLLDWPSLKRSDF